MDNYKEIFFLLLLISGDGSPMHTAEDNDMVSNLGFKTFKVIAAASDVLERVVDAMTEQAYHYQIRCGPLIYLVIRLSDKISALRMPLDVAFNVATSSL